MFTLRRIKCDKCPMPIDNESPSPEMPMYLNSLLAALAPVAMVAMRPCAELKPCAPRTKYVGGFDEQPMPESLAIMCGGIEGSKYIWVMAAVTESWPHPAHSVDMAPS